MLALNESEKNEFLHLHKSLMIFTNKRFSLYDKFKTPDDIDLKTQEDIKAGIMPIREEMYNSENINLFCEEYNQLNEDQRSIVKSWKFVYSDDFFILKHLKSETVLITKSEDKLYGVVGISGSLEEFFPKESLPVFIRTKLLPFKDKIVYDGFFGYHNIHFGGNITKNLLHQYSKIKGLQGLISRPEPK